MKSTDWSDLLDVFFFQKIKLINNKNNSIFHMLMHISIIFLDISLGISINHFNQFQNRNILLNIVNVLHALEKTLIIIK